MYNLHALYNITRAEFQLQPLTFDKDRTGVAAIYTKSSRVRKLIILVNVSFNSNMLHILKRPFKLVCFVFPIQVT